MSDIPMEQKLKLVQQVRSRYNENRFDMSNREQILYGKTVTPPVEGFPSEEPSVEKPFSSFKLRLFFALLLFGVIVFMDVKQIEIGGLTTEKLYGMIAADYEEKLEEWVEAMSGAVRTEP